MSAKDHNYLSSSSQVTQHRNIENIVNPNDVRKTVLKMLFDAKASHLGSNMSVIELLVAAYSFADIDEINSACNSRSRVIVSKGHCAAATYATMAHFGILQFEELSTYHRNGSLLSGHVSHAVKGVEHSTGALGHGLPVAVGCALGLRFRGFATKKVFCIVGDGEIQEGSIWEAVMYAAHANLENLFILVDNNRISSITLTEHVVNMNPLSKRFEGFGCNVVEVDGHDLQSITSAVLSCESKGKPNVLICNTIKGKGIPFAEWEPIWHYRSLTNELYLQAISNLEI